MRQLALMIVTAFTLVLATQSTALATSTVGAPEIDPGSLSTGLALVSGAALMLRSRMRSR